MEVDDDFVPTKASQLRKSAVTEFKSTVFIPKQKPDSRKIVRNFNSTKPNPKTTTDIQQPSFDIKRARHEIINFGISGLHGEDKEQARIAMAVKLGAIPPKRPNKNYKELLAEKRVEKKRREEELALKSLGKDSVGASIFKYQKPIALQQKQQNRQKQTKRAAQLDEHYGVVKPKIFKKKK